MNSTVQDMTSQFAAAESNRKQHDWLDVQSVTGTGMSLPIAGLGGRTFAFLIDYHIRVILALAWLIPLSLLFTKGFENNMFNHKDYGIYFILLAFVPPQLIYFLYHPVLEILQKGRTPGKRMAGVRIVTAEGITPTAGALLVRNLFRIVDSLPVFYMLGLSVAFFNKRHLRIGDIAAKTLLVYEADKKQRDLELSLTLGELPAEEAETLHELLDRWKQLDRKLRIQLACDFLEKIDRPVPEFSKPNRAADRILHDTLKALIAPTAAR